MMTIYRPRDSSLLNGIEDSSKVCFPSAQILSYNKSDESSLAGHSLSVIIKYFSLENCLLFLSALTMSMPILSKLLLNRVADDNDETYTLANIETT